MRWVVLTLAAAAAGGLFAFSVTLGEQQSVLEVKAVAAPAAARSVSRDTDKRIHLAREERFEASADGGFKQVPLSLLRVNRRMHYGDFEWDDTGVPLGPVTIRVDLRTQLISVFRAGHEIGTAVALYGADRKETPLGNFPILWKGRNHRSSLYDAPMPFTLRLTGDGVAIHGSDVRAGAATHGCVGVPTEFARLLFEQTRIGDVVTIIRTNPQA